MPTIQRLVIDTDPGVDDAHAIMMVCADQRVKLEALTIVAGNVSVEQGSANALRLLDLLGKSVPVYQGASNSLVVPATLRATSHGADGLGDVGLSYSSRTIEPEPAAQALIRLANANPGELTLLALGPLTNLALALKLDPDLPKKYKRLVVMGGAVYAQGNSWNPSVEFNSFIDPDAAFVVFSQWGSFTLVPWETAMRHGLSIEETKRLASIGTSEAEFFHKSISKRFIEQIPGRSAVFEPDAIAAAVTLEPDIVLENAQRFVDLELAGGQTRGQTIVDWFELGQHHNSLARINIVLHVDHVRFLHLLAMGFGGQI